MRVYLYLANFQKISEAIFRKSTNNAHNAIEQHFTRIKFHL